LKKGVRGMEFKRDNMDMGHKNRRWERERRKNIAD
jgi:hypothetical protein